MNFKIDKNSKLHSLFNNLLNEAEEKAEKQPESAGKTKKIQLQRNITVEEIVEKINSIRAGRSLSNKNIRLQLEIYFDELEPEEKLSLYAFLSGIAQIITGEISGNVAIEPEDVVFHPDYKKKKLQNKSKSSLSGTDKLPIVAKEK